MVNNKNLLLTSFLLVLVISLVSCGGSNPLDYTFDITIREGEMVPRVETQTGNSLLSNRKLIKINQNDNVTFRINSDVEGGFHLHGYDLIVDVGPTVTANMNFSADATGKFDIMLHEFMPDSDQSDDDMEHDSDHSDDESVVHLGVLEVHPN
jgi:hypothetical protein